MKYEKSVILPIICEVFQEEQNTRTPLKRKYYIFNCKKLNITSIKIIIVYIMIINICKYENFAEIISIIAFDSLIFSNFNFVFRLQLQLCHLLLFLLQHVRTMNAVFHQSHAHSYCIRIIKFITPHNPKLCTYRI